MKKTNDRARATVYFEHELRGSLSALLEAGEIVPIGSGLYSTARKSIYTGKPIPAGELEELLRAVAERLGRQLLASAEATAYNSGSSTQVPTGRYNEMSGPPLRIELSIGGTIVHLVAPTNDRS